MMALLTVPDPDLWPSASAAIATQGPETLAGTVRVAGYKHSAVLCLAASVMLRGNTELRGLPNTSEIEILLALLESFGAGIRTSGNVVAVDASGGLTGSIRRDLSRLVHGSVYLIPAVLGAVGMVQFGEAGGDQFGGSRRHDHILSIMRKFGARFRVRSRTIDGVWLRRRATVIDVLDYSDSSTEPSGPLVSSATKAALLAAAACNGSTVIRHPHDKETERDLIDFLVRSGCGFERTSGGDWILTGEPTSRAVAHTVIPDPTEVVTWIAAATYLRSQVVLENVPHTFACDALPHEMQRMSAMGISLDWSNPTSVTVCPPDEVTAVDVVAKSAGLCTDSQPLFALMLLRANGQSRVTDEVWRGRFHYAQLLSELGADLALCGSTLTITPCRLHAPQRVLRPQDTRSAAVATLACLGVEGRSLIGDTVALARGYDGFLEKLSALGARVRLIDLEESPGHVQDSHV